MKDKKYYIIKMQKLYNEKNGEKISDEDALCFFESLVALVEVVYQPVSKNLWNKYQQKT
jgi:hypothetical protein